MHAPAKAYLRRFGLASPLAISITVGLFVLLVVLTTDDTNYVPVIKNPWPEFRPLADDPVSPVERDIRPLPPPPPAINGEPLPVPTIHAEGPAEGERKGPGTWTFPTPPAPPGPPTRIDSRDPLIVLVPRPDFPERARVKGIEGYAIVTFTVTAAGTTRDARIVEASPAGWFEKSAVAAANRFRFQPKLADGKPVEAPGMMYKFVFDLED